MAVHPEDKSSNNSSHEKKKKKNSSDMRSAAGRALSKKASAFSKRGAGATY